MRLVPATLVVVSSWAFFSLTSVLARLSNITVDDAGSAIQYSPSALWSAGLNCKNCTASPDVIQTSGGTWHDSTHSAGGDQVALASLRFTGTAVYVYCIIAHSSVSPNGNSDMTFFLDGHQVGAFALAPTGEDTYDYNVPVYANGSIQPGLHTVTIQNGRAGGPKSLMLLDYIVYTTGKPESTSTPPSSSLSPSSPSPAPSSPLASRPRTTTIIAAVVPSVIALLFATGVAFFCCQRRRKRYGYYGTPGSGIASTTGVDGRSWSPVALTPRVGTAPAAPTFDPTRAGTEPYPLDVEASSQQPYAAASELNISSCTERSSGTVPHGSSKAEEVGMVLLSPAGLRLLPTLPTSSTQTSAQAPRSHTSLSSDVPPAYDDVPCNDIAHI